MEHSPKVEASLGDGLLIAALVLLFFVSINHIIHQMDPHKKDLNEYGADK